MLSVVMGPPCAGKTFHVQRNRGPESVVIDLDALAVACGTSGDPHQPSTGQHQAAMAARRALIDWACVTGHIDYEVWLIHCKPSAEHLAAYRRVCARLVLLDPGERLCVARAAMDKRPAWTPEAIAKWYASEPLDIGAAPSRDW